MAPRVSVLLSVHNGASVLPTALGSLAAQTFTDYEVVAVDDGSTDGSGDLLEAHARKDPRLRVIRNRENIGLTPSLNRALREARASYVARQDADDLSEPLRFERQVAFLDAHPEVGLLGTGAESFSPGSSRTDRWSPPQTHGAVAWGLLFHNVIVHSSVMMRTAVVREAGGYDERFRYAQDYELWTRLPSRTRVHQLPEPLLRRRIPDVPPAKYEASGETVRFVFRRSLQDLFGTPPSEIDVEALVRLGRGQAAATREQAERLPRLIPDMYHAFVARHAPSETDRSVIQDDARERLRLVARVNAWRHPLSALAARRAARSLPR